ncbi:30S ribosomal protein S5 [Candidatus Saccharibacteria bacterium]|nr:30S ribosomal protein S5 [Candidatus Saccharibacteria bacterium]
MAETEKKAPRVINKSGTLKMDDKTAATRQARDIAGRKMERRSRRDRGRGGNAGPKEFDEITIAVDRVSRTVAGGRRMRFKALVAMGDHKNRIGIGVAKGNDVTTAVAKAGTKAKKSMITFKTDGETICHETRTKVTGADVLMKPAAPGTGIIAGGTVRAIMGLTGVKNLISKSLGSTNKVNIAYAVLEGLRQQVKRSEWVGSKATVKPAVKAEAPKAETAKPAAKAEAKVAKPVTKAAKPAAKPAVKKPAAKPAAKSATAKKPAAKAAKAAPKKAAKSEKEKK